MQTQIRRNNMMSMILLLMFPVIILATVWVFLAILDYLGNPVYDSYGNVVRQLDMDTVNGHFLASIPWVIGGVGIWFAIAYFANTSMIASAVNSRPLSRRENPRIYNIVENLCMSCGMEMPRVCVVAVSYTHLTLQTICSV